MGWENYFFPERLAGSAGRQGRASVYNNCNIIKNLNAQWV